MSHQATWRTGFPGRVVYGPSLENSFTEPDAALGRRAGRVRGPGGNGPCWQRVSDPPAGLTAGLRQRRNRGTCGPGLGRGLETRGNKLETYLDNTVLPPNTEPLTPPPILPVS